MSETEHVLVVDDDDVSAAVITELCTSLGYRVSHARKLDVAEELVAAARPDVVVLELGLSDDQGFALLESLKYDARTREIPVLVVTALSDIDTKLRGVELGADDFLTKPFKLYELETRIRAALQVRQALTRLREAQEALSRGSGSDPVTGAGTFATLHAHLDHEMTRARRYGRPLCALLFSVKAYQRVRGLEGETAANAVLREAVKQMRVAIRTVDRIFRLDTSEFVLLLPETGRPGGELVASRIVELLMEANLAHGGIESDYGIASVPDEAIRGGEDLLRQAHEGMRR